MCKVQTNMVIGDDESQFRIKCSGADFTRYHTIKQISFRCIVNCVHGFLCIRTMSCESSTSIRLLRTAASCGWRRLEYLLLAVILSTSIDNAHLVWMTNTNWTTSHPSPPRRSFHRTDRCRRSACWTASRLTAKSADGRRWKRHRRRHGNRSRAACSCCSLIRRSCCRTPPTATDQSTAPWLPRVDDNLGYTSSLTASQISSYIQVLLPSFAQHSTAAQI